MAFFEDGNASEVLDKQCDNCPFNAEKCPVYLVQGLYNYDQMEQGAEKLHDCLSFLVDDAGVCRMKELLMKLCTDFERYQLMERYALHLGMMQNRAAM